MHDTYSYTDFHWFSFCFSNDAIFTVPHIKLFKYLSDSAYNIHYHILHTL